MNDSTQAEGADADPLSRPATTVVVGGGLAGITTALALADSGVRVTLLEGRPRLGGLAFSFRRDGLTVDNGQHVYLRCCTAYRWFLDRVDGAGLAPLQDRLDVPVLDAERQTRTQTRQNRPHGAARTAASGEKPRDVSPSVARRARQGRTCRTGPQGPGPRRSGSR